MSEARSTSISIWYIEQSLHTLIFTTQGVPTEWGETEAIHLCHTIEKTKDMFT